MHRNKPHDYGGSSDQYTLAPENVMTLAHFSVSSAMKLPKSAGELTPDELTEDTSDAAIGLTFALMKDLSAPDSAP